MFEVEVINYRTFERTIMPKTFYTIKAASLYANKLADEHIRKAKSEGRDVKSSLTGYGLRVEDKDYVVISQQ